MTDTGPMPLSQEDIVGAIIKMHKLGMSTKEITEVVFQSHQVSKD